jgi:nitrogenase molybdenum-iron protein NifN
MISHYKEPVDIASSNFSEESTIFGGDRNFNIGIDNLINQYKPEVIGICSACLSETIGENIPQLIRGYQTENSHQNLPVFIHASTPSYQGSHMDGFHEAVSATVKTLAVSGKTDNHINIFPGFVSTEDIRHLKDILDDFQIPYVLFPDYSDSLDNPNWEKYLLLPQGGTSIKELQLTGTAKVSIEFGYIFSDGNFNEEIKKNNLKQTAGSWLQKQHNIPFKQLGLPIGIKETDRFFTVLERITGRPMPQRHQLERGRLIDAYVDGHKYHFGKRAIVYGEEDLVIGMVSFLEEIGIETILVASGGESAKLKASINHVTEGKRKNMIVMNEADFETMNDMVDELKPDIMIGNSKGYYIAKRLGIPLVRIGFPVHDRFGGQRIQHLCYKGTQQLFDRITNALIEYKQEKSPIGYKYI